MEDLTRTSFPGIGCFFYRGSKSNGAGGERCFHEVQECRRFRGVVGAAWMGSRSSNGDPQLSNFDNETFGMEPFFHRTSANRVSNFDRRRATWPWLFVFGDFPAFSKGGSLDFSRLNPPLYHCSDALNRRTRGVFRGIHWIHWIDIMGRENFVISRLLWKYSHSKLSS